MAQKTLKKGENGNAVKKLQRALAGAGFPVTADGDFGPATEKAVKAFQRARGLGADGVVGPRTWAALNGGAVPAPQRPAAAGAPGELSVDGCRFIARFEGFCGTLYDDPAGHCTIGYGHLVHHGPRNGSESAEFTAGITEERGLELLQDDARTAADAVLQNVRVPLTQQQFDALVSFVFNVGGGAFADSTLLRELNAGRYDAVPAQLDRWVKAGGKSLPGLVKRRKAEGVLFAQGTY